MLRLCFQVDFTAEMVLSIEGGDATPSRSQIVVHRFICYQTTEYPHFFSFCSLLLRRIHKIFLGNLLMGYHQNNCKIERTKKVSMGCGGFLFIGE